MDIDDDKAADLGNIHRIPQAAHLMAPVRRSMSLGLPDEQVESPGEQLADFKTVVNPQMARSQR